MNCFHGAPDQAGGADRWAGGDEVPDFDGRALIGAGRCRAGGVPHDEPCGGQFASRLVDAALPQVEQPGGGRPPPGEGVSGSRR